MVIVKVKSETSETVYEVNLKALTCSCPDYHFRKAKVGGLCKHLIKEIERCTNTKLDFTEIIEKDDDALNFINKFGEETLELLKRRGDVFEERGRLRILK